MKSTDIFRRIGMAFAVIGFGLLGGAGWMAWRTWTGVDLPTGGGAILTLSILGITFIGMGGGITLWFIRRAKVIAWVKMHGQRVLAEIVEIGPNESIEINGKNPWQILAQWEDPVGRRLYQFRSDSLDFNPEKYCKNTVEVLIDPKDPKRRYWMDLSFLPELA